MMIHTLLVYILSYTGYNILFTIYQLIFSNKITFKKFNLPECKTKMAKHRTTTILLLLLLVVKDCFMAIRTAIAVPLSSTIKTEMLQHTHVGRTNRLWNHTESKPKNTGLILYHLLDSNSVLTGYPVIFGTLHK